MACADPVLVGLTLEASWVLDISQVASAINAYRRLEPNHQIIKRRVLRIAHRHNIAEVMDIHPTQLLLHINACKPVQSRPNRRGPLMLGSISASMAARKTTKGLKTFLGS